MKNLNKILISAATLAMVACSSMDIAEPKAVSGNFPADFSYATYTEVHPELVGLQIRDYVAAYNASLTLTAEQKYADSAAFFADTAMLRTIYTDPLLAGVHEDIWNDSWLEIKTLEITDIYDTATVWERYNLAIPVEVVDEAGEVSEKDSIVAVYEPITFTYAEDGTTLVSVTGRSAKDAEDEITLIVADYKQLSGKQQGSTRIDSTLIGQETLEVVSEGALSRSQITYLKMFNFLDTEDDLARLKEIEIDTMAVKLQYVMFGKDHGWAYRKCTESEESNPISEYDDSENYAPATKMYCLDSKERVREIK